MRVRLLIAPSLRSDSCSDNGVASTPPARAMMALPDALVRVGDLCHFLHGRLHLPQVALCVAVEGFTLLPSERLAAVLRDGEFLEVRRAASPPASPARKRRRKAKGLPALPAPTPMLALRDADPIQECDGQGQQGVTSELLALLDDAQRAHKREFDATDSNDDQQEDGDDDDQAVESEQEVGRATQELGAACRNRQVLTPWAPRVSRASNANAFPALPSTQLPPSKRHAAGASCASNSKAFTPLAALSPPPCKRGASFNSSARQSQALPALPASSAPAESRAAGVSDEARQDAARQPAISMVWTDPAKAELWRPISREPFLWELLRFRVSGKDGLSPFRAARLVGNEVSGDGPIYVLLGDQGRIERLPPDRLLQISVPKPVAAVLVEEASSAVVPASPQKSQRPPSPAASSSVTEVKLCATPQGQARRREEVKAEPVKKKACRHEVEPWLGNTMDPEKLRCAVRRQIDYYFGSPNYERDHWLRGQADWQGWTSLRLVAKFNRMRELTHDFDVVLECAQSSDVVELSDCGEWLRRRLDSTPQQT